MMRSHDQGDAANQPDAHGKRPRPVVNAQPVQFKEAETAGDGHKAGERSGRKVANGAIQKRNNEQDGIDAARIEASSRLAGGLRRLLIRRSTLEHVGGSPAY